MTIGYLIITKSSSIHTRQLSIILITT